MAEYLCEFVVSREDGEEVSEEATDRLVDAWMDAVEAENLCTGGSIREYTQLDYWLRGVWMTLWGLMPWARKAL